MKNIEKLTPPIGAHNICQCSQKLIFDEVFGWLHMHEPGKQAPYCPRPQPVGSWRRLE